MSLSPHLRRIARVALAGACALCLAACALPSVTRRPAQTEYRLQAPALRQAAAPDARPVILRVLPVQAAPGLDGVDMLYSEQPLQLMPYRDSRWLVPPAEMIGSALRQTLARQAWVAAVEGDGSPAAAAWSLSCRLERLEHDVYAGRVVLQTRCQLFDDADSRLRAAWGFDGARSIATQNAPGYAQATQDLLDQAVSQALRRIVSVLPSRVAPAAPAASAAAPAAGH